MKGLIWGPTFKIADKKLNEIKQKYLFYQYTIKQEIQSKYRHIIVFDNGDIWKAINANKCHLGERANISYVHRSLLSEDEPLYIPRVIRNCTYHSLWHGFCIYE